MKELLHTIVKFFSYEKYNLVNNFYRASVLGDYVLANKQLRSLLAIYLYEENIINFSNKELTNCLEDCDITLLKLRLFLDNLRGVNIDIIENEDTANFTLISY